MNGMNESIMKVSGPCVVLAGAGTGKTHTIVEKIKYLIKNEVYNPERVVCITFSNEAANNLISRVRGVLNGNIEPIIRTFHALSADLLRKYGDKIGIKREFNILDTNEAKVILNKYLKVSVGNCHKYIGAIGNAKDLGISLDSLKNYLDNKLKEFEGMDVEQLRKRLENLELKLRTLYLRKKSDEKKRLISEIDKISSLLKLRQFINSWNAYEKIKSMKNYMDYSDLNKEALRLLKECPGISDSYDYIIIDEFQDTNKIQLDLLTCLANRGNVMIVGDLNQSIYRFRGAYRKNFNEFKEKYNVKFNDIHNLDKSYRSSNKILKSAHNLILNNYSNKDECFEVFNFENRIGDNLEVYEMKNAKEESRNVVDLVKKEIDRGIDMREICVMFRTHQQGRIIKQALEFSEIPFVSANKNSLLKERSVKTVIDYLTILNKLKRREKDGGQAWWDLIYQLNFGKEDLISIGRFIKDNKTAENFNSLMLSSLLDINLTSQGKMAAKILIERIKKLIPETGNSVPDLVRSIFNIAGLVNGQKSKEEKIIMLNLRRFHDLASVYSKLHFSDLSSFLQYLSILSDLKIELEAVDSESEGVRLMTLHATKGLEYKTVIITNMAQKRFPIESFKNSSLIPAELSPEFNYDLNKGNTDYLVYENEMQNQLFEERRLCYVAFTRAKEKLILTYAGEYGGRKYFPSQFLYEIKYKDNPDISFFIDSDEKYEAPKLKFDNALDFNSNLGGERFNEVLSNVVSEVSRFNGYKALLKDMTFSPSSLLIFSDCQKKFEYKYVYNMPDQGTIYWDALILGSFVHKVLEGGVQKGFSEVKSFENFAREMYLKPDWESVDLDDALNLIRVFFERNRFKYGEKSKTEIKLNTELKGIKFTGFADRIDFGSEGIEIVDYKTGNSVIPMKSRNWQLGYYALASSKLGKVRRITLDMLRHEKPLEFELGDNGDARALNSDRIKGFNIYEIENELVETARLILDSYDNGFSPCSVEKNCDFCNEWVYRL